MNRHLEEQRRLAGLSETPITEAKQTPSLKDTLREYAKTLLDSLVSSLPKRLTYTVTYGQTLSLLGMVQGKGTSASDLEAEWTAWVDILETPPRTRISLTYKDAMMKGEANTEFKFGYDMKGSEVVALVLKWFADK